MWKLLRARSLKLTLMRVVELGAKETSSNDEIDGEKIGNQTITFTASSLFYSSFILLL
jgi:hypothetical protein